MTGRTGRIYTPRAEIEAALHEYDALLAAGDVEPDLADQLRQVSADLRAELEQRETEPRWWRA